MGEPDDRNTNIVGLFQEVGAAAQAEAQLVVLLHDRFEFTYPLQPGIPVTCLVKAIDTYENPGEFIQNKSFLPC